MTTTRYAEVAVPTPLRQTFDYRIPDGCESPATGARVSVTFGNRSMTAVVLANKKQTSLAAEQIKPINAVLDRQAVLPPALIKLMLWAADYYQHPVGECISTALPNALRKGLAPPELANTLWEIADNNAAGTLPANARKQHQVMEYLQQHGSLDKHQAKAMQISTTVLKNLTDKGCLRQSRRPPVIDRYPQAAPCHVQLNEEQQQICDAFDAHDKHFAAFLLEGVTGSGKTEVYLQLIEKTLQQGRQALVLVPEIGLTPQTIERFRERFACPLAVFHSSLTDNQRLLHWQQARCGQARIIIGTRSALFTATSELGLIIVDEEHDLSYKQQDGLRYSARDMACMRAKLEDIPVVLASATPTLESLHNVQNGKFRHWRLTRRAGNAKPPQVDVLDIRKQPIHDGLAESALPLIEQCIERGEQALLFINRRGYAPGLVCHDCGWIAQCQACDARMTVHHKANHLRCHHCGAGHMIPACCPDCQSLNLIRTGAGTERIEQSLKQRFADTPVFRIDRDTTAGKGSMQQILDNIHQQSAALLVGTQMLAKGHHFPNVTLVLIIDADQSLTGTDFRATERFGQLLTQVTGRAGRAQKPGRALIQTHFPDHPQLLKLIHRGYHAFAMDLLGERRMLQLPPFSYQALIRLEDKDPEQAVNSLQKLKQALDGQPVLGIGPFPAALQRRAWYFRYQLLLQARSRRQLKQSIQALLAAAPAAIRGHRQRWSIDIDPQDMS